MGALAADAGTGPVEPNVLAPGVQFHLVVCRYLAVGDGQAAGAGDLAGVSRPGDYRYPDGTVDHCGGSVMSGSAAYFVGAGYGGGVGHRPDSCADGYPCPVRGRGQVGAKLPDSEGYSTLGLRRHVGRVAVPRAQLPHLEGVGPRVGAYRYPEGTVYLGRGAGMRGSAAYLVEAGSWGGVGHRPDSCAKAGPCPVRVRV